MRCVASHHEATGSCLRQYKVSTQMAAFQYKQWSVSRAAREPLLQFLIGGLRASGCTILWASEPTLTLPPKNVLHS